MEEAAWYLPDITFRRKPMALNIKHPEADRLARTTMI
jgi:hypothetical protein